MQKRPKHFTREEKRAQGARSIARRRSWRALIRPARGKGKTMTKHMTGGNEMTLESLR